MLHTPGIRSARRLGRAWLSLLLSMVLLATLSIPTRAWAEPVRQSDVRAQGGQAVLSGEERDAGQQNGSPSNSAGIEEQLAPAASQASASVESVGPLHVYYALDDGDEREMSSSTGEYATHLEALHLEPSEFETLHLRMAPADDFSFDENSGKNQITSLSVGWQSTTHDGILIVSEVALEVQSDGSRTCSIPSALLRPTREADYDYFSIGWKSNASYPNAFGVYRGNGLIADPEYPSFDFSSLLGTYRSADGTSIALSSGGTTCMGSIADEVDKEGNASSCRANQIVRSYDVRGNLVSTAVVVGTSVSAYFIIGTNDEGVRTLTAQDNYSYHTLAGQEGGHIAQGTVFTSEIVARIGAKSYSSLQGAFAAAQDGDVIELVDDLVISEEGEGNYVAGKTVVIDLGGHALIGDSGNAALCIKSGDVTVRNGTVRALEGTHSTILAADSRVTLEDLVLENSTKCGVSVVARSGCSLAIKDPVISVSALGGAVEAAGGTVDIYGGMFSQTGFSDRNSMSVAASNGGTVTIHDGAFTSEGYGLYVDDSGGTINVEGGSFSAGKAVLKADADTGTCAINVKGGSFAGAFEAAANAAISLTGGTFDADASAYLADGYYQHVTTGEVLALPSNASYRVEHYWQNVADDGYTLADEETLSGAPYAGTAATAKRYEGFSVSAQGIRQQEIRPEGTTVVKVYYDRQTYQVTWDANGGTFPDGAIARRDVRFGAPVIAPVATREGFVLLGWDASVPQMMPASNLSFKAQWVEAVSPELPDVAVVAPEVGDDPKKPSVTISNDAKRMAAQIAADALATIALGKVPACMTQQEADAVRGVIGDDPSDRVSTVVVVSAVPVEADDVADDAALIAASLGEEHATLMHFDLKVSLIVTNHTAGTRAECALTEIDEPLEFEIRVLPSSIAGKHVRIAFVHGGQTGFLEPLSVDYARGIIVFPAAKYSTYAVILSDASATFGDVEVRFESNGGSSVASQTVKMGGMAVKPVDPMRDGYAFAGWFADEALTVAWDFAADTVQAPMTLYAKWVPVSTPPSHKADAPAQPKALAATGDPLTGAVGGMLALSCVAGAALVLAAAASLAIAYVARAGKRQRQR